MTANSFLKTNNLQTNKHNSFFSTSVLLLSSFLNSQNSEDLRWIKQANKLVFVVLLKSASRDIHNINKQKKSKSISNYVVFFVIIFFLFISKLSLKQKKNHKIP